mmetsp:Transcript_7461/g.6789  ORF Transcript_7461/g.6789 Transcript_7461/m.6789 type:complete len:105 (+) Transcript_7461:197-511(+)|eukprot:CAMPEP_0114594028 /NCGR_PEP_ID=MMETSP0125-20121206/15641_1 /TAXON_ID=485358 ORGANISM="Aristerostoma sp., Strain ATCC 50986" /NCGR_SAMPLE_ID=MMETSP0125 /ASSEMBLY_ACC=CAM_ASM_000245 /LENGTH=104 /DNA_ID=CAMNT_0001793835 /DNA_START=129 /DNA_END=443 /DNA_ORIENTATION=+
MRNLLTSDQINPKGSPSKKKTTAYSGQHLEPSYRSDTYGFSGARKKNDSAYVSSFKDNNLIDNGPRFKEIKPERKQMLTKYMHSSSMKDVMTMDARSSYRGVFE